MIAAGGVVNRQGLIEFDGRGVPGTDYRTVTRYISIEPCPRIKSISSFFSPPPLFSRCSRVDGACSSVDDLVRNNGDYIGPARYIPPLSSARELYRMSDDENHSILLFLDFRIFPFP